MSPKFSGNFAGLFLLFFGTISSVNAKVQLLFKSKGFNGIEHNFEKPGVQLFFMFLGMLLALPFGRLIDKKSKEERRTYTSREHFLPVFSSISGTIAVYTMTYGLIRINVSIYMMLRSCLTIFSSLFSYIFLGRRLKKFQLIGIILTIFSLIIVGAAGVQMQAATSKFTWKDRLFGIIIVVLAQVLQGGQLVWDEYMLKNCNLDPIFTCGIEGLWGVVINILIVVPLSFILPGNDPSPLGGSLENAYDSLLMLINSWPLIGISTLSTIAICGYDISGMTVTATMSSVHRTIFEALRTLTTWIVMLFIGIFSSSFGEKWVSWSWLQLGGFVLLVFSSLVFNEVIHIEMFE